MRNILAVSILILLSTIAARAQTTTSYANCSALNGALISTNSGGTNTVDDIITVADLLDTDLVEISISVTAAPGSALGSVDVAIEADTDSIFTGDFIAGETSTDSYDPTNDQTSVQLTFTSSFNPPSGGGALEMSVDYSISCTPGAGSIDAPDTIDDTVADTTEDVTPEISTIPAVTAYLGERNQRMLDERPDRPRMLRKQLGSSIWGETEPTSPDGWDGPIVSNFRATPNRVRAHIGLADIAGVYRADLPVPFPSETPTPPEVPARLGCWDAWAEAHYSSYQDAGDRDGDFAIGYLGVDCQIHSAIVVGLLAQVDWLQDDIGSIVAETDGVGWMAGPYMTARLTQNLFLDVRAAWGQSDNDTDVAGVTASFDTTRWLIDGQLTGSFSFGDVRISPEISIAYIEEEQAAYTDSNSNSVAAQTVSAGQLRFGPEVSRLYVLDSGVLVEPHFALRGIWDFGSKDVTIAGVNYNAEGLRGAAEIGFTVQSPNDFKMHISAKYDGIGVDDYQAYGGQILISIPLP